MRNRHRPREIAQGGDAPKPSSGCGASPMPSVALNAVVQRIKQTATELADPRQGAVHRRPLTPSTRTMADTSCRPLSNIARAVPNFSGVHTEGRPPLRPLARVAPYTLKREDSRTLVLVDDVGCISLTCNDALGTSTGGDTRRNLLRTRCGPEPPGNSSSIGRDVGWGCVPARSGSDIGRRLAVALEVIRRPGGNTFCTHLLVGVT